MRILHLLSQHPDSTGSGFYLQNILRQARGSGHENILVAGHSPEPGTGLPQLDGVASDQCCFVNFGCAPLDFTIPGMSDVMPYPSTRFQDLSLEQVDRYCASYAETIRTIADRFQPDIIHSHHLWLMSATARRVLPDLPMVSSCHSTDLRQLVLCPHLRERVVEGCRSIDRVLALSSMQAEQICADHGRSMETIDIIGAGFDDRLFCLADAGDTRTNQAQPDAPIELLYAGKLSYAKGVDVLLESYAKLCAADKCIPQRLHLHLAGSGSGPEAAHCLKLAEELGQAVTVHGRIDQQQLAGLMQRCHIFVLPSFYEGLPLVLLEALACGCRLVATDLPGSRELLAAADVNLARTIPLPAMKSIDQPEPSERPDMINRLSDAMATMVDTCRQTPVPDHAARNAMTSPYTWNTVFARINASYQRAVKKR